MSDKVCGFFCQVAIVRLCEHECRRISTSSSPTDDGQSILNAFVKGQLCWWETRKGSGFRDLMLGEVKWKN